MKIFDCFIYNNEDLMLDIRLNSLSNYVEKFIIVEACYDHQGNKKKKLNFSLNKYKKFQNKIIYKILKSFPQNLTNWERENFQRNYITEGLENVNDEDYVIVSDVDEIPNLSRLNDLEKFKYTVFEQKMFYYKLNLLNETNPTWRGSRICKKKYLKSPQWLREQKIKKRTFLKFYRINWNIIKDGGWHFSFLMTPEQIKDKLSSYAHAEYNNEYFNDLTKINESISKGLDLFDRNFKYNKVNLDNSYPEYLYKNQQKFKDWII